MPHPALLRNRYNEEEGKVFVGRRLKILRLDQDPHSTLLPSPQQHTKTLSALAERALPMLRGGNENQSVRSTLAGDAAALTGSSTPPASPAAYRANAAIACARFSRPHQPAASVNITDILSPNRVRDEEQRAADEAWLAASGHNLDPDYDEHMWLEDIQGTPICHPASFWPQLSL